MNLRKLREGALDWMATVTSTTGVLTSMVTFDLVQRVAARHSLAAQQRAASAMAWSVNRAFHLTGGATSAAGVHHAVRGRPYIIVSNHQSLFDISLISEHLAFLQPRYVSKLENARGVPGISYNLRKGGSALIDRKNPEQSRVAIADVAKRMLRDGFSVAIFPEGTRTRTGAMKSFREGGLRTLIENAPGVEVLPVTTDGGWRVFQKDLQPVVRDVDMHLKVHAPVLPVDPRDAEGFRAFVLRIEAIIRGGLPEGFRAPALSAG